MSTESTACEYSEHTHPVGHRAGRDPEPVYMSFRCAHQSTHAERRRLIGKYSQYLAHIDGGTSEYSQSRFEQLSTYTDAKEYAQFPVCAVRVPRVSAKCIAREYSEGTHAL